MLTPHLSLSLPVLRVPPVLYVILCALCTMRVYLNALPCPVLPCYAVLRYPCCAGLLCNVYAQLAA